MHNTTRWLIAASLLFTLGACSSDYTVRAAPSHVASSAPGALPQIRSSGGHVLKTPRIVPIVYKGDPLISQLETFLSKLPGSSYWHSLDADYGVGDVKVSQAIVLDYAAPPEVDETGTKEWFQGEFRDPMPELGAVDTNAIYMLFLPPMTTATYFGLPLCSGSLSGFHDDGVLLPNTHFTYAVVARCGTDADSVTIEASHQLVDAAANPYPSSSPAFVSTDAAFLPWAQLPGAQVATMCQSSTPASVFSSELGFAVHQVWSNAAAAAGKSPCIPQAAGDVYFNASPVLTEDVVMGGHATKGIKVAVGETKTIDLDLFSDGDPGGPWTISTVENTESGATELTFGIHPQSGKSGDVVKLSVTRVKAGASDWGGTPFLVQSTLGDKQRFWPVFVSN
jgi:hypothetical protein